MDDVAVPIADDLLDIPAGQRVPNGRTHPAGSTCRWP
jgi:hypothetical protein